MLGSPTAWENTSDTYQCANEVCSATVNQAKAEFLVQMNSFASLFFCQFFGGGDNAGELGCDLEFRLCVGLLRIVYFTALHRSQVNSQLFKYLQEEYGINVMLTYELSTV